jgi:glucokinase
MNTNNKSDEMILGIDIGGSHITAGLVDMTSKKIAEKSLVRKKVNRHGSAEEILSIWSETINEMQQQFAGAFRKVGFAMPGPFDYENGISLIKGFDKYEALYGVNIRNEIAARTTVQKENILFLNDADAFLEGEVFCGAAQGFHRAVGLTLGTGLGSCVYADGVIVNALLNELHFKDGIAEDYISTRWFEKAYFNYTGKKINGVKPVADVYLEDEHAKVIFNEFADNLVSLLHHCVETFNPEVIVLGGNIANAFDLFIAPVNQQLSKLGKLPLIRKAKLGENAALIGAAGIFAQQNQLTQTG